MKSPFFYFGFGSNLNKSRLHIHCPSAQFLTIAELPHFRLSFTIRSENTWQGGVGDIQPSSDESVWGALWLIDGEDSEELDKQEGVFRTPPAYQRKNVQVRTPADDLITCRTYQVVSPNLAGYSPSLTYKETMLKGAKEIGLPDYYIDFLENI